MFNPVLSSHHPSAETHSHSHLKASLCLRGLFIVANVIFNTSSLVICALIIRDGLIYSIDDLAFFLALENYFTALACLFIVMDIFTAGGFIFYGRRLAEYLKNFPMGSVSAKHASARRVYAVSVSTVLRVVFELLRSCHLRYCLDNSIIC